MSAQLSRRRLFQLSAGLAVSPFLPHVTLAAAPTEKRLVVVILRGGLDGLHAVVPYGDPAYRTARGRLALGAPDAAKDAVLDLTGFFGLHPALKPLLPWWQAGELAAITATALPYLQRSHFEAQAILDNGTTSRDGSGSGWLNRALPLIGGDEIPLGLAIGNSVPLMLSGEASATSWSGGRGPDQRTIDAVRGLFEADPLFRSVLNEVQVTTDRLAALRLSGALTKPVQPKLEPMAPVLAQLLLQPQGARVATMEVGGWDTHAGQGLVQGTLAMKLGELARGLAALATGLKPVWKSTVVLVVTEFGRQVAANGTGGSDHGTGGLALAMGGAIAGGRVLGRWPGLAQDRLFEGRDLAATSDLRQIFRQVAERHLGISGGAVTEQVLPGTGGLSGFDDLIRV